MAKKPFFEGFTADERREVSKALDRVDAIRNAYREVTELQDQAQGVQARAQGSGDGRAIQEAGEAVSATAGSRTSLMTELADYSTKFNMPERTRAGAARFVGALEKARAGDLEALATVKTARIELDEAKVAAHSSVVQGGDRPGPVVSGAKRGGVIDQDRDRDEERQRGVRVVENANPSPTVSTALPAHFADRYVRAGESIIDSRKTTRVIMIDRGNKLDAPKNYDRESIRAIVDVAQARGWSSLNVQGEDDFRKAIWTEAASRGLAVKGYKPTEVEVAIANNTASKAKERDSMNHPNQDVARAFREAHTPAQRVEASEKHPQLAKAFGIVAAYELKAAPKMPAKVRDAFMARIRDNVAADLVQGRQLPDSPLRDREHRYNRSQEQRQQQDRAR